MPDEIAGKLECYMVKSPDLKAKIVSGKEGKKAVLEYRVIGTDHNRSLLELIPETGRFHQIRLQLMSIGCPILGDTMYGSHCKLPGGAIALRGKSITFIHPVEKREISIESPIPGHWPWKAELS